MTDPPRAPTFLPVFYKIAIARASYRTHHVCMHRRASSYMRGGSIFGVVVIVALLSVAAIAIDSNKTAQTNQSMTAQVMVPVVTAQYFSSGDCVTIDGKKICSGVKVDPNNSVYTQLKCEVGNDFIVRMNPDGTDPIVYYSDRNGKVTDAKSQCPSISAEATVPSRSDAGKTIPARQCTENSWKCYIKVCFRSSAQGATATDTKCVLRTDKPVPFGKTLVEGAGDVLNKSTQNATLSGLAEALAQAKTPEERAQIQAQLGILNEGTQGGILDAYNQQIRVQETAVQTAQSDYNAAIANLERCETPGALRCGDADQQFENAQTRWTQEQQRLEDMQNYAQQLSGLETELQPSDAESSIMDRPEAGVRIREWTGGGDDTFGRGERDTGAPCQGIMCWLRGQTGANTREADMRACQYNNDQAACLRVSGSSGGVGAYGAYGAYPSGGQQGCGTARPQQSQGGIFGLIGSIASLFTQSNSSNGSAGCTNGVPNPSCQITASPQNITAAGQSVTLSWQSNQAFQATLSNSGNVATNGSMTVNPQTTTTYTLSLGGYIDNRTGQQLRGQCSVQVRAGNQGSGSGDTGTEEPKAQISCRPTIADVGMSVAVSYACENAATSVGSGFSTSNQMSGSATPVVQAPTLGTANAIYGVTCSKQGKTDSAQCTVEINQPTMVLIANPANVASGEEANIGWVTSGMTSCAVSSPTLSAFTSQNVGNTSPSGVAKTPPITQDTKFALSCTTRAGATKSTEITVSVD